MHFGNREDHAANWLHRRIESLRLCQQRASLLGGSCRHKRDLLTLPHYNRLHFSNLLLRSFGDRVAPTPDDNGSLKFDLPKCKVGENVEKTCAVSACDSLDRDFTRCALTPGGGN
jgi:hypothetical protein